ncbi:MAG: hypothetical protein K9G62_06030 [Alphaproteobacteria bacterium]|nr:hypothetical protein [Alphaproteobacteria bacterium]
MSSFTKSIVYSGVVLALGLVAIFAIRSNMIDQGAGMSNIEPAAGQVAEDTTGTDEAAQTQEDATATIEPATGEEAAVVEEEAAADAAHDASVNTIVESDADAAAADANEAAADANEAADDAVDAAADAVDAAAEAEDAAAKAEDAAAE